MVFPRFPLPLATTPHILYAPCMLGRPHQLDQEEPLYDTALKLLTRRAHSASEMKKALGRRCTSKKLVQSVLDRLRRERLIDDARFARQFARHRSETRKQGPFRIARDLRARGVADPHIEAALKVLNVDVDPVVLIRQRLQRKLRLLRKPLDARKLASLYRSLLSAGFPSSLVYRELQRITQEDLPELDVQSE